MRNIHSKYKNFTSRSRDWVLVQTLFKLVTLVFCLLAFIILSTRIQAQNDLFFTHGSDTSVQYGETVSIPLIANGLKNINSMQFTLHFNPHVMQYQAIQDLDTTQGFSMNDIGTSEAFEGRIYFVFIDPLGSGATIQDGDTLMNVQFEMVGSPGSQTMFGVQSFPVELQAFGMNGFKDFTTSRIDITCQEPDVIGRYFSICNQNETGFTGNINYELFGDGYPVRLIVRDTSAMDSLTNIIINSDSSFTVTGIPEGTYVSEIIGNDSTVLYIDTLFVIEKDTLTATFSTDDGSCPQTDDGDIFLQSIQNGLGPYTVLWPDGSLHYREYNDVKPGSYDITIIDAQRCESVFSVEVGGPEAIVNETVRPVSCPGVADGRLIVDVLNLPRFADSTLLFSLDSNVFFRDVNFKAFSLSMGPLTYFIKDGNGCVFKKETFILSENEIFLQNVTTQDPSCFNSFDGEVSIIAALRNEVNGNFSFEWNGNSGQTFTNDSAFTATQLSGGIFEVTITHSGLHENCQLSRTFQLNSADTINISLEEQQDESCFGNEDGRLSISSEGGELPHSYLWSNGDSTSEITGLNAGKYYVTVTDANQCNIVDSFQIDTGILVEFIDLSTIDNACYGTSQGELTAVIKDQFNDDNSPLTYQILPLFENSIPLSDDTVSVFELPAGTYTLEVSDTTGCVFDTIFEINQADSIGLNIEKTIPQCDTDNGSLRVEAFGGNDTLYTYEWSAEIDTNYISNIGPGIYTITVTDGTGCSKVDSIELPAPTLPSISHTTIVDVECNGGMDGFIAIEVEAGTFPISNLSWESGDSSLIRNRLSAGIYSVTITDSGNCERIKDFVVQEPEPIEIEFEVIPDSNGNSMGAAIAIVTGGTPPYSYVWNTSPIQTDSIADMVPEGTYQVLIRDDNGCTATAMVEVPMSTNTSFVENSGLKVYPNPSSGLVFIQMPLYSIDKIRSLKVRDIQGRVVYTAQLSAGQTETSILLQSSGIYLIEVLDKNGAIERLPVLIQQ